MSEDHICKDCLAAAFKLHHGFNASCPACQARALSRSPGFDRSRKAGALDRQYKGALAQFGLTHEAVKASWDADFLNRRG